MIIYIDIVMLENFIMNFIILIATSIICENKIKIYKITLSAFIGSIYSICTYFIKISNLENIIAKFAISILMTGIALEFSKIKFFIKKLSLFYLTSLTFGGLTFALLFLISPENIVFKNNHFIGVYPIKVSVLGGITGLIFISIVSYLIKNKFNQNNIVYDLNIYVGNEKIIAKAYFDSGNLLKEPISNEDVIIVEKNIIDTIDNNEFKSCLNEFENIIVSKKNIDICKYKFKIIPYSSLGNENGILVGFKPDYIEVIGNEKYVRNDIWIGIYNGYLDKTNKFNSLIGLNILKRSGKENENLKESKI